MATTLLVVLVVGLALSAVVTGLRAISPPTTPAAKEDRGLAMLASRPLTVATVALPRPWPHGQPEAPGPGGFHGAIARAACEHLGLTCQFTVLPADRLLDSLNAGAVDIVAADLPATPELAGRIRMVRPHGRAASVFLGRAESWDPMEQWEAGSTAPNTDHLRGRVVVAASGSPQAEALRTLLPARASVILAPDQDAAVAALRRGEADAALLSLSVGLAALNGDTPGAAASPGQLIPLGGTRVARGAGGPVALAVAPGDDMLAQALSQALDALWREGRPAALAHLALDPLAAVPPSTAEARRP